ncbi:telomere-protecting terminal protein Tpg [Streptomyces sp. NPDC014344]|uniref:telomere-protecting terminal protein Tpg n=1 Tax=Streptomyces sp. NPDC014344 TaxID=3364871 RepID=UPI0036F70F1B
MDRAAARRGPPPRRGRPRPQPHLRLPRRPTRVLRELRGLLRLSAVHVSALGAPHLRQPAGPTVTLAERDTGVTPLEKGHAALHMGALVRSHARRKDATTGGIVIDTRARLGCTAPSGSTDQDRIRRLTVALPLQYAARLFDAQEAGAGDARLHEIAAEALREVYFQDGGRRAGSLEGVRFTDIEHLEFGLWRARP